MKFENSGMTQANPSISTPDKFDSSKAITVDLVKKDTELAIAETNNNLVTVKESIRAEMVRTSQLQELSDTLSVEDQQSIIVFGQDSAQALSTCADDVIKKQNFYATKEIGSLMGSLSNIMKKIDPQEIDVSKQNRGFIGKLFYNFEKAIDKLMNKYNTIGADIENVCTQLRTYEQELQVSNRDLEQLYDAAIESYNELCRYVIAGEHAIEEITAYETNLAQKAANDPDLGFELNKVTQAKSLLEQRVHDLRLAESVALQTIPSIRAMEYGNLNLARKVNSAFIVTIPVFKNAIAQALIAQKQQYQAKALKALDDQTNEMLIKNSENISKNLVETTRLAGSSSIKIETIQTSWSNIMNGIKETQRINEELTKQREKDKVAIERINSEFISRYSAGTAVIK